MKTLKIWNFFNQFKKIFLKKTKTLPTFNISNKELESQPTVKSGTLIMHKNKNGEWEKCTIRYAPVIDNKHRLTDKAIAVYETQSGETYLAAIKNKLIKRDNLKLYNDKK